ncbi:hypothetical protein M569_17718, partial [Genlisea aurea]
VLSNKISCYKRDLLCILYICQTCCSLLFIIVIVSKSFFYFNTLTKYDFLLHLKSFLISIHGKILPSF